MLPGKTAAAAVVEMNTADDAKWIVEHVNGNVPQSLTTPVTVTFKFKGKGFGKGKNPLLEGGLAPGLDLSALSGALAAAGKGGDEGGKGMPGANPAVAGLLQLLVPLVGAVAGMNGGGKGGWYPPRPPPGMQICRYFEAGLDCPRDNCTFWHGDGSDKGAGKGSGCSGTGQAMLGNGAPGYNFAAYEQGNQY